MNDNNDFITFVFMVLFGNHRLLFWSFGLSLGRFLRPKQQPLISKQNKKILVKRIVHVRQVMQIVAWWIVNVKAKQRMSQHVCCNLLYVFYIL